MTALSTSWVTIINRPQTDDDSAQHIMGDYHQTARLMMMALISTSWVTIIKRPQTDDDSTQHIMGDYHQTATD